MTTTPALWMIWNRQCTTDWHIKDTYKEDDIMLPTTCISKHTNKDKDTLYIQAYKQGQRPSTAKWNIVNTNCFTRLLSVTLLWRIKFLSEWGWYVLKDGSFHILHDSLTTQHSWLGGQITSPQGATTMTLWMQLSSLDGVGSMENKFGLHTPTHMHLDVHTRTRLRRWGRVTHNRQNYNLKI